MRVLHEEYRRRGGRLRAMVPEGLRGFFTVSIGASATLLGSGLRYLPVILAALGLTNSLGIGLNLWRESPRRRSFLSSGAGLFIGSTVAYSLELWYGWQIIRDPTNKAQMYNLAFVLFGVYAIALGRAWELLGAREWGLLVSFFSRRSAEEGRKENLGGNDPE